MGVHVTDPARHNAQPVGPTRGLFMSLAGHTGETLTIQVVRIDLGFTRG